jgi:16S rRNA (guanine527-N7)-methyltransferase
MTERILTPGAFRSATNVSRETLARLEAYAALLTKWQNGINLVGSRSLEDLWRRHMLDSAQVWPLIDPKVESITDLGSGAGFPGLVLAIVGGDASPTVSLIESDVRKGVFLNEVIRVTGANARVITARIEEQPVPPAEIVCARACARLPDLLDYSVPMLRPDGAALFLKGETAEEELTEADKDWTMSVIRHPSRSNPGSQILEIRDIRRVAGRDCRPELD